MADSGERPSGSWKAATSSYWDCILSREGDHAILQLLLIDALGNDGPASTLPEVVTSCVEVLSLHRQHIICVQMEGDLQHVDKRSVKYGGKFAFIPGSWLPNFCQQQWLMVFMHAHSSSRLDSR